jgi:hypothetical protein
VNESIQLEGQDLSIDAFGIVTTTAIYYGNDGISNFDDD